MSHDPNPGAAGPADNHAAAAKTGAARGLKILRVLTRANIGGPTRQCIALWHAMRAMGHTTLLVVGRCDGEPEIDLTAAGIPYLGDALGPDRGALGSGGWIRIPAMGRAIRPLADLRARRDLRRLIRRWQPDLIHSHTSKAGWLVRSWIVGPVPVVHTFHGHVLRDHFGPWMSWLLTRVERLLARRTAALTAVSHGCAADMAAFGVARGERIRVIPPALELERFRSVAAAGRGARHRDSHRRELGLAEGDCVLLWVGRMAPVKQPMRLVELMAACPGVHGLALGDGELLAAARAAAPANLELRGSVADPAPAMAAADLLVLTSAREGCPLVAVEAAAAGLPVLGLDAPGVRDALVRWELGEVHSDLESLGRRVRQLAADPALRAELGARGRARLGRRFDAARNARRYGLLYQRVIRDRNRGALRQGPRCRPGGASPGAPGNSPPAAELAPHG